jgi:glycosyltransferase involved in cell wall biosynthesis
MRILIVMDPGILVPPKGYGGHERLVEMFAKEYARMGHEVHLLVTSGSSIPGCTVHGYGKEGFPPAKIDALKAIPTAWWFLWKHRNRFDLVHNFGRLFYLLPILNHSVKKIMTYGREISSRNIQWINKLPNKNLVFTGCSNNLISRCQTAGRWKTVYNAIDFSKYTLQSTVANEAPLVFLGRIERVKGCHTAIAVAKATGHQLIIAGNVSPLADEQAYFEAQIAPHIDGKQIIHVGQVNDAQKNEYLGKAKALLFAIEWNEPFGMVMVEAMACGTPVIGFNKGSVKEVITNSVTGYIVENMDEMIAKVADVNTIDRASCRERAQQQFHVSVVAQVYLMCHY